VAERDRLGLLEQARVPARLNRDVEGLKLLDHAAIGRPAPHQHRDVTIWDARLVQVEDQAGDPPRLPELCRRAPHDHLGLGATGRLAVRPITFWIRSGIDSANSLATEMICGRLRPLVEISTSPPTQRSTNVTMFDTSEPRHW
jgi:hypothetical protein